MSNNHLSKDKQIAVTAALAEGNSIRSIERMTGIHRDRIMRLGVRVGQGCAQLLDQKMRNFDCNRIELDEIWSFIGKKVRHLREDDDPTFGDVWTYCAIGAETKLGPSYKVASKRNLPVTIEFISDLKSRMNNRIQDLVRRDALISRSNRHCFRHGCRLRADCKNLRHGRK
jgi:hypothetical protein